MLTRGDAALPGGSAGSGKTEGVPDDQGFERVDHHGMVPEPREPAHSGFRAPLPPAGEGPGAQVPYAAACEFH